MKHTFQRLRFSRNTATVICGPVGLCLWLLPAPTAEWSIMTETTWPAEPKIFTRWPFLEKKFADAGLGGLALEEAEWAGLGLRLAERERVRERERSAAGSPLWGFRLSLLPVSTPLCPGLGSLKE